MYDYFLQFTDEATAISLIGPHIPPCPIPGRLYSGGWRPDISLKCQVQGQAGFFLWVATTAPDLVLQLYSLFSCDSARVAAGKFILSSQSDAILSGYALTPNLQGRTYPLGSAAMLSGKAVNVTRTQLCGTNLSVAEFGSPPGVLNADYAFPTLAEAAYYYSKGMNVVRLPFLWERIQPVLGGALDPAHVGWLTKFASANPKMTVLLDVHNYGRYGGKIIGVDGPTNAQFCDLWSKLATLFKGYPNAAFGLMNEPHDQDTTIWLGSANAAIAAIRSTGATNLITVPGASWTGAPSWTGPSDNSVVMLGLADAGRNFCYEVHLYFDSDNSGTSPIAVSATIGSERLQSITAWARKNSARLFLGEFGAANNSTMLAALSDCAAYMNANPDVWLGWTYWSGGPWWGPYMYSIEPAGADAPQMTALLPYLS